MTHADETKNAKQATPDWARVAGDALDIWQNHLTALANDPKAKAEMARFLAPMSQMFVEWSNMMQQGMQGFAASSASAKSSAAPKAEAPMAKAETPMAKTETFAQEAETKAPQASSFAEYFAMQMAQAAPVVAESSAAPVVAESPAAPVVVPMEPEVAFEAAPAPVEPAVAPEMSAEPVAPGAVQEPSSLESLIHAQSKLSAAFKSQSVSCSEPWAELESISGSELIITSAERDSKPVAATGSIDDDLPAILSAAGRTSSASDRSRDLAELAERLAHLERELDGIRGRKRHDSIEEELVDTEDLQYMVRTASGPTAV